MAMHPFFNPYGPISELLYTVFVVLFCFLIYIKTKEIYDLTKHKGVNYFRNTFLFFGLSYISGFILHLFMFSTFVFDFFIPRRVIGLVSLLPVGYFSTMAIFYLTYSTVWKKVDNKKFLIASNLIAILLSLVALATRSMFLLIILQFTLFIIAMTVNHMKPKVSKMKVFYWLMFVFWLINLVVIEPRRLFPLWIKIIFQLVSIGIFVYLYTKVSKWVK